MGTEPSQRRTLAIRLKGKRRRADVQVFTTEPDVVSAYADKARANPTFAKFSNIRLSEDGEPDHHDLHHAWAGGARRAAQWLRSYIEPAYSVVPPFEDWEVHLYKPPRDAIS